MKKFYKIYSFIFFVLHGISFMIKVMRKVSASYFHFLHLLYFLSLIWFYLTGIMILIKAGSLLVKEKIVDEDTDEEKRNNGDKEDKIVIGIILIIIGLLFLLFTYPVITYFFGALLP